MPEALCAQVLPTYDHSPERDISGTPQGNEPSLGLKGVFRLSVHRVLENENEIPQESCSPGWDGWTDIRGNYVKFVTNLHLAPKDELI